jgi:hypothetical protein
MQGPHIINYAGYRDGGGGASFNTEYQAVLDYAVLQGYTLPSASVQTAENAWIQYLIDNNIWDDLDIIYNFYTDGDSDYACINRKNPGTFQGAPVNSPTFTSLTGFALNGTNQRISTGFNPTSHSAATLYNASMIIGQVGATAGETSAISGGGYTGIRFVTNYLLGVNSITFLDSGLVNGSGLMLAQRLPDDTAPVMKLFKDGSMILDTDSSGASGIPNTAFSIGCRTNATPTYSNFQNGTVEIWGHGKSLESKESLLNTAWATYKAAV